MSTLLSTVHHHILDLISQLRQDEGTAPYVGGECASLALALYTHVVDKYPGLHPCIQLIFRHEMDVSTDEEISHTLSHVVFGLGGETYDINGNNAVENWEDHVDDFEIDDDEIYNELRVTLLSHELPIHSMATRLSAHCNEYGVPLSKVQALCERWGIQSLL
jgi:hypothetical protein